MTDFSSWPPWLLVAVAALVGYFVVSKVIDFMKRGSVWDETPEPPFPDETGPAPEADRPPDDSQTSMEAMRRYEREVKRRGDPG